MPTPTDFDGVLHGGAGRHRMEDSGSRLVAEPGFDHVHDAFEIASELLVSVMRRYDRHVLTVVAKIEHQKVEVGKQVLPIGKVGVGGEAVAVREQKADAVGAAVAPHANFRPVFERNVKGHARSGKLEVHGDRCRRVGLRWC